MKVLLSVAAFLLFLPHWTLNWTSCGSDHFKQLMTWIKYLRGKWTWTCRHRPSCSIPPTVFPPTSSYMFAAETGHSPYVRADHNNSSCRVWAGHSGGQQCLKLTSVFKKLSSHLIWILTLPPVCDSQLWAHWFKVKTFRFRIQTQSSFSSLQYNQVHCYTQSRFPPFSPFFLLMFAQTGLSCNALRSSSHKWTYCGSFCTCSVWLSVGLEKLTLRHEN